MNPGEVLLDKYRVEELLGTGGMGRVIRVAHLVLGQEFALKILLPHMAESAETVSRFMREAQSTSRLKSEHTARVFDVGKMPDGAPFMVMEYLAGNDLNQILRHHGPQRSQVVCDLMLQACEALAEAHAHGIVHRDIKPSNFFITSRPDGTMLLKILDFGISKTPIGVTELTNNSTVIGTPTYMSPEQMKSGKAADARSDIWSMGIVMYQLLNGRPPFVGESYAELVIKVGGDAVPAMHAQLPVGLTEVILRCLEKDPHYRQQNVSELARMLAPYASDPVQGAQSAMRTTRILSNKGNAPADANPLTMGGGLSPMPPPSKPGWSTGNSSLSHGRGQVTHTHQVRGGGLRKGRLVGAIGVLVLAIGGGVYIGTRGGSASDSSDSSDTTHVSAPTTGEAPPVESKPAEVKPAEPKPEPKPEPTTIDHEARSAATPQVDPTPADPKPADPEPKPVVVESKPIAKPDPKPVAKPAVARTDPKPVTKPAVAKTDPKPVTKPATKPVKKKKPSDDLFDSRH